MVKEQVVNILGEPLNTNTHTGTVNIECWSYSKGKIAGLGDFLGWVQVQVCFVGDKVESTSRSVLYNN